MYAAALAPGRYDHLEAAVDAFLGEWISTIERTQAAVAAGNFATLVGDIEILNHAKGIPNYVSKAGYAHLRRAGELLLERERLQEKLSIATGVRVIVEALVDHAPKAQRTGTLSEHAVIAGARRRLASVPRDHGAYVLPLIFAPSAKSSDFRVGPVRIVAKSVFLAEDAERRRRTKGAYAKSYADLRTRWRRYLRSYDHVAVVDLEGFEADMGWPVAREAAEFVLNLVRMLFRYGTTDDIRIGGGFVWETTRCAAILKPDGGDLYSWAQGPWGTILEDNWQCIFTTHLHGFAFVLSAYASAVAAGTGSRKPVRERVRYAHRLIAETYAEPHDPIRLVRLVSALEALAVTHGRDKAHQLAWRCACAGGWSEPDKASEIYDAVREAYHRRSQIVHGDAPATVDIRRAFFGLEQHLLEIVLGFMVLHWEIAGARNPLSVRALRREVESTIDAFFWSPYVYG